MNVIICIDSNPARHGVKIVLHMDAPEEGRQIWRESEKREKTEGFVFNFVSTANVIQHTATAPKKLKQMPG